MNVDEYMKLRGITDEDVEEMARRYEDGTWEPDPTDVVHSGSHLDCVGKKRVTVVYDAADAQRVAELARTKGIKPSDVYRAALHNYLAAS